MKSSSGKERLDAALVTRGLAETRARAQAVILGGGIAVDGTVVTKPATTVSRDSTIELVREPLPYVSRGGLKLRHALDTFNIAVKGRVAVDVGASTGGFTDVLLQAGAARVYAIDVGYGQLAWMLRHDPRVIVMERTNIKHVSELPEPADLAVIDVSFISLRQVLPAVERLLTEEGEAVVLIKPQFEAGRAKVRKGVVRDPMVWREILQGTLASVTAGRWTVLGLERSPIRGPAGNVEFLAHLSRASGTSIDLAGAIERVVSCG